METFLQQHDFPSHLVELLKLMGVCSIRDLLEVDPDFIADIEVQVRAGNFDSQVDFKTPGKQSLENRLKYFGINLICTETFQLRVLDRKKLLGVSKLAQEEIDKAKNAV